MTVNISNSNKDNQKLDVHTNTKLVNPVYTETTSNEAKVEKKNTINMTLSSPWVIYYKKVAELLYGDEEVEVSELEDKGADQYFTIATDNFAKLAALKKVLKNDIKFGNITLHINFMDASSKEVTVEDWKTAFEGNEYFIGISGPDPKHPSPAGSQYALFSRDIIDFYNDDLTDCYGYAHELPANIASEITNECANIHASTVMDSEKEEK